MQASFFYAVLFSGFLAVREKESSPTHCKLQALTGVMHDGFENQKEAL
jgi:hypothetical protein